MLRRGIVIACKHHHTALNRAPLWRENARSLSTLPDVLPSVASTLQFMQSNFDLSGFSCIVASGFMLRAVTVPFVYKSHRTMGQLDKVAPQLTMLYSLYQEDLAKKRREVVERGGIMDLGMAEERVSEMNLMRKAISRTLNKGGVSIAWIFSPIFVQIPVFVMFSRGVRSIAFASPADESAFYMQQIFDSGGCFWFENLNLSDPFCILPIAAGGLVYSSLEYSLKDTKSQGFLFFKYVVQGGMIFLTPFLAQLPAASQLYLCTTASLGMAQVRSRVECVSCV